MSNTIDQNLVNQFNANVLMLSQQKESRLRALTRQETQASEVQFFDRIGLAESFQREGRAAPTKLQDIAHSRRACSIVAYDAAAIADTFDKARMIYDPNNQYSQAISMAQGRKIDDVVLAAALGNAGTGKDGLTSVALPDAQRICAFDGSSTAAVALNLKTLRKVKRIMDSAEVPDNDRIAVVSSAELEALLGDSQLTSADWNTVKCLVDGQINTFLGFNFVRSERLALTTVAKSFNVTTGATTGTMTGSAAIGSRRCVFYQKDGIISSIGQNPESKVEQRADLNYAWQVFNSMQIGAVRMEDVRVVEVITAA